MNLKNKKNGYTLIELMVTTIIVIIIAFIVFGVVFSVRTCTRITSNMNYAIEKTRQIENIDIDRVLEIGKKAGDLKKRFIKGYLDASKDSGHLANSEY